MNILSNLESIKLSAKRIKTYLDDISTVLARVYYTQDTQNFILEDAPSLGIKKYRFRADDDYQAGINFLINGIGYTVKNSGGAIYDGVFVRGDIVDAIVDQREKTIDLCINNALLVPKIANVFDILSNATMILSPVADCFWAILDISDGISSLHYDSTAEELTIVEHPSEITRTVTWPHSVYGSPRMVYKTDNGTFLSCVTISAAGYDTWNVSSGLYDMKTESFMVYASVVNGFSASIETVVGNQVITSINDRNSIKTFYATPLGSGNTVTLWTTKDKSAIIACSRKQLLYYIQTNDSISYKVYNLSSMSSVDWFTASTATTINTKKFQSFNADNIVLYYDDEYHEIKSSSIAVTLPPKPTSTDFSDIVICPSYKEHAVRVDGNSLIVYSTADQSTISLPIVGGILPTIIDIDGIIHFQYPDDRTDTRGVIIGAMRMFPDITSIDNGAANENMK